MSRIGIILLSVFLSTQFLGGQARTRSNGGRLSMNISCEEDELLHICTIETVQLTNAAEKPRIYFFGDVQNITHARIVESNINTVTRELLVAFPHAKGLEFVELPISAIESGAFDNASRLEMLLFNTNNISQLEPGVFSGLTELRNLSLENSQIRGRLPADLFASNTKLATLSMKGNLLTRIENNPFSHVSGTMYFVDFSNNNIEHFDLSQSSNIVAIDVSTNRLTELKIPRVGLERLKASQNRISRIVPNGVNKQLTELNLSHNRFSKIPSLAMYPSLNILDLSYNEIEAVLPADFPAATKLTELSLTNNRLTRFDVALRNLVVLDLSSNLLKSVDVSSPLLSTLEVLYLSRNSIETVKLAANNSLWQLAVNENELTCANLRTHLPLLAKVVVRMTDTAPCKAGYMMESDFCCKET